LPPTPAPLPIDALLPEIIGHLRGNQALVIEAPPGAGKTTRVPRALLEAGLAGQGEVVVLQPRRLPARLAATRVAEEMGQRVGETVGYTVRFEEAAGPATRLRFVTEGILTRRLLSDPELRGVAAVVLDEFHERHLATDLALGLLAGLARRRSDLRLVVMSATLDAEPVRGYLAEHLGDCPGVRSEGRLFPVDVSYLDQPQDQTSRPLAEQVAGAVRRVLREGPPGDVLVFLPGAGDIRRAGEALEPLARSQDLLVLPLHGELPPSEQNRAVRPADRRKVILSTNVAETSVTIDGVVAVIDSGLARMAAFSPWSGLGTLQTGKISQAAAIQRAGRAGRTRPGQALRLYTRHDFDSRRSFELPEVARQDLAEPLLALHALGVRTPANWSWFEPPPAPAVQAGEELLRRLGAVDGGGGLTDVGRELLRFPTHPRLGRLLLEGERRGVAAEAAAVAALIGERDIRERSRFQYRGGGGARQEMADADLLVLLDAFEQARRDRFSRDRLRALDLDGRAVEAVERVRRQLAGALRPASGVARPRSPEAVDEALGQATLAAFPDRVMRRRGSGSQEAVLAGGGTATVGPSPPGELLVAVDAEERAGGGPGAGVRGRGAVVRLAAGIEAEWLLEVADGVTDRQELRWDERTLRVEQVTALMYGQIALEETRRPAPPSPEASQLLAAAVKAAGARALFPDADPADLQNRLAVLRQAFPDDADLPALDAAALEGLLQAGCEGRISFAELREAGLPGLLAELLPPALWQRLRQEAPERLRLPGGREVPVHYEPDRPPWIESRLQDFFGMSAGPAVARGRVPLVVHLLAPNGRAVQVTRDLAGFWRQHYPALRRELGRRYPRHAWPEDGATAVPPAPKPRSDRPR
jgi:ATP-dependent helicase HrpB